MSSTFSLGLLAEILNWKMFLEVPLIGAAFFFIYHTLRRLGTWTLFLGVLLLAGFFPVANLLDLSVIRWAYSNLSHVVLIALIVLFQPELRKVLERAASFKPRKEGANEAPLAALLASAVSDMARQKMGALLVFPGREPIREYLSGGYPLGAEPSVPLLMSIFDSHSQGHDGALIVEGEKFVSFGVRLPLSDSNSLPEEFGTRHHAAMGLTERSDAMVICVSEERGGVAVFQGRKMRKVADKEVLAAAIREHWENLSAYGPRERRRPRGKLVLEAGGCLFLAFVFWWAVAFSGEAPLERVYTVPVEYTAMPRRLALVGEKPTQVVLHVGGAKSNLEAIDPSRLTARIDLSGAEAGRQTFAVAEENISLPRRVTLLSVEPPFIEFRLGEVVEMEVPVRPQLVGRLPKGLKLASVKANPEKVRVVYPGAEAGKKVAVLTTPVYLEGVTENARVFCKIIAPSNMQPVAGTWPDVEVVIRVAPGK